MTHIKMKHFLMVLCLCIFSISLQAQDLIVTGEGDSLNYKITKVKKDPISMKEIYPHFRLALTGGWSYLTARLSDDTPAEFKDYSKELKSGFHYDVDFSYYFVEQLGVGFKYHEFLSSNKMDNVYATYPDGSTEYGSMSDDIRINFIGPFFSTRFFNSTKKNCLLMDLGLG
ncbi:MAG: hypothetical protein LBT25_06960, partial [Candidatus Symbiothrix sp.]|nr:hypothetical protein [Candidatus Symbiothrix sp.]